MGGWISVHLSDKGKYLKLAVDANEWKNATVGAYQRWTVRECDSGCLSDKDKQLENVTVGAYQTKINS